MGLPQGYSTSSNVSKETAESSASILRAAAWLRRRFARGQRALTAGVSLFVVLRESPDQIWELPLKSGNCMKFHLDQHMV